MIAPVIGAGPIFALALPSVLISLAWPDDRARRICFAQNEEENMVEKVHV